MIPAADAGWPAVESVMTTVASSRNCWCQFHVLENSVARNTSRKARRMLLQQQVETLGPPRGLVALANEEPVGWCGVEPRSRLRHILATGLVSKNSLFAADDPEIWAIYCILVPPEHRRRRIGSTLLSAAITHARAHGARAIEGLPIDTARRGGELPPGFSTGTLEMFQSEGFTALAALPSGRTLVYKDFHG